MKPNPRWSQKQCTIVIVAIVLIGSLCLGLWYIYYSNLLKDEHRQRGQTHIESQRYPAAIQELKQHLSRAPEDVEGHLLVARLCRRLERYSEARKHLELARASMKSVTEEYQLEHILFRAQTGELAEVETEIKEYLHSQSPYRLYCVEALCRGYLESNRFLEALKLLAQEEKIHPQHVQILWLSGLTFDLMGVASNAERYYEKAVAIDPQRDVIRYRLADVHVRKNHFEKAHLHLTHLLESRWVNQENVLLNLMRCCVSLQRLTEARKHANELLKRLPSDPAVLIEVGKLCLAEQNENKALIYAREAVRLKPGWPQPRELLVECLRQMGSPELDEQVAVLNRLQKLDNEVMDLQQKVLPRSPHDPDLLCKLGTLEIELDRISQGITHLLLALKHDPRHQDSHRFLANYYQKHEQQQRADYHRRHLTPRS